MAGLILSSIAISIFVIYNIVAISFFGIPWSLSQTFYLYNNKYKHPEWKINNLGYIFVAMMWVVAFLLLPGWLSITECITPWSHNLTILPFLGAAGIIFVGSAPAYKSCDMENIVHSVAAGVAAVFSLLWVCIVCWKIMWIIPVWAALCIGGAYLTKTQKSGKAWWLEMIAFGSTFSAILIESIILL